MRGISKSTVLPGMALLVGLLAALLLIAMHDAGSADDRLTIDVFARQYSWSFGYPDNGNVFSKDALHVPLGGEIQFEMYSQDVAHSFWVPEWQVKEEIPPAAVAAVSVTPEKAGTYQLICAELCGIEHAYMRAKVVVESPAEFSAWVGDLNRKVPAYLSELIRVNTKIQSIHENSTP